MSLTIGKDCQIHPSAIINVKEGHIGDRTIIKENVVIEGNKVVLGNECFFDKNSSVGGGSCFDKTAFLIAGDWLHVGVNSHINIAYGVEIGNEVGLGMDSKIFTHSAYLDNYRLGFKSQWQGVKIGNNVFLPSVHINPGVTIGNEVVVTARSVINKNLPDNCFAGGNPIKVLRQNFLPNKLTDNEKNILISSIIDQTKNRHDIDIDQTSFLFDDKSQDIIVHSNEGQTVFNLINREIFGLVTHSSKSLKDQLRRNGIRFRYKEENGVWVKW